MAVAEHLAELLGDYAATYGRPLWLVGYASDGWDLIVRQALDILKSDYVAVRVADGVVLAITDAAVYKDVKRNVHRELPTAAPAVVRIWARNRGDAALELSPGWAAACKRMAALLDVDAAV